jgi:hypothetical protein
LSHVSDQRHVRNTPIEKVRSPLSLIAALLVVAIIMVARY